MAPAGLSPLASSLFVVVRFRAPLLLACLRCFACLRPWPAALLSCAAAARPCRLGPFRSEAPPHSISVRLFLLVLSKGYYISLHLAVMYSGGYGCGLMYSRHFRVVIDSRQVYSSMISPLFQCGSYYMHSFSRGRHEYSSIVQFHDRTCSG